MWIGANSLKSWDLCNTMMSAALIKCLLRNMTGKTQKLSFASHFPISIYTAELSTECLKDLNEKRMGICICGLARKLFKSNTQWRILKKLETCAFGVYFEYMRNLSNNFFLSVVFNKFSVRLFLKVFKSLEFLVSHSHNLKFREWVCLSIDSGRRWVQIIIWKSGSHFRKLGWMFFTL